MMTNRDAKARADGPGHEMGRMSAEGQTSRVQADLN